MVRRITLILLISLSSCLWAASIEVRKDREPVSLDETFQLNFILRGEQDGEPDFAPLNADFELLGSSESSSFSMINGSVSKSKTYSLTVSAKKQGTLTIPAISFGKDSSRPDSITVRNPEAPSGSAAQAGVEPMIFMTTDVDAKTPYVQQQMVLTLKIYSRQQWADAQVSEPEISGVETLVQRLGKGKTYETRHRGKAYAVTELRYTLLPQESGRLDIKPFRLTAKIATGKKRDRGFGNPFNDPFFGGMMSRQSYRNKVVSSDPLTLEVKPIPKAFNGQHWLVAEDIQLHENWSADIKQLQAGEPVTRTIVIIGDGLSANQFPNISMPEIKGLRNYPDQPVSKDQQTGRGLLGTRTQKFALIPSAAGEFELPAVEIPWWNSRTDSMDLARLPASMLQVEGVAAPVQPRDATVSKPPGTATESATDEDPVAALQVADRQQARVNRWLLIGLAGFAVLWLVTLVAWLRARRRSIPGVSVADETGTRSSKQLPAALKELRDSCQSKQAGRVKDALLDWAQIIWSKQPPANLQSLAQRVSPALANELTPLIRQLYANGEASWDASVIAREAALIKPQADNQQAAKQLPLQPLYRMP